MSYPPHEHSRVWRNSACACVSVPRSNIVIDGMFSHSVRKRSAFERTATDPEADPATAAGDEIRLAIATLAAVHAPYLYARVDMIRDNTGTPRIMELEMCEPTLFLREHPPAAEALAAAIEKRIRS